MGRKTCAIVAALALLGLGFPAPATGQSATPPQSLQIVILQGEGALNNIKSRTAREPIIQVQDENHRPVAGAAILFTAPDSGPSGTFLGGSHAFTTTTDFAGRAHASGFTPNQTSGDFEINVQANYKGLHASTNISQTNQSPDNGETPHATLTKWILAGGSGVGVALAIYFSTRSAAAGNSITAGNGTVTHP
jgi:hypothetical protein